MHPGIGRHIRSNLIGYLALFVALGGTAWAAGPLAPRNSVNSAAIVNGQVKRADLAASAVNSAKVSQNAIGTSKVLDNSLLAQDLAPNAIDSSRVADNSLTGADINESTLGQVPSALLAGLGRSGVQGGSTCDPENATGFSTCASVSLTLSGTARVILLARVTAEVEIGADSGNGLCRLVSSRATTLDSATIRAVKVVEGSDVNRPVTGATPLLAVTPPLGQGPVSFSVECNQLPLGAIVYRGATIAAVALSPS
jgi:hypothetical protein